MQFLTNKYLRFAVKRFYLIKIISYRHGPKSISQWQKFTMLKISLKQGQFVIILNHPYYS